VRGRSAFGIVTTYPRPGQSSGRVRVVVEMRSPVSSEVAHLGSVDAVAIETQARYSKMPGGLLTQASGEEVSEGPGAGESKRDDAMAPAARRHGAPTQVPSAHTARRELVVGARPFSQRRSEPIVKLLTTEPFRAVLKAV